MKLEKKFKIEYRDPKDLIHYDKNAKLHPQEQIDSIALQIVEAGFDQPIVINKNNIIIKGHGRTLASLSLGLEQVPVIIQTLEEYQEMAIRIGDNKSAESPWDNDLLRFELGTLKTKDINLNLTAIALEEIEVLLHGELINREDGKGIADYAESHETTDIRQIILIMTQEEFEPMLKGLLNVQEKEQLENNAEAVQYLLEMYENSNHS